MNRHMALDFLGCLISRRLHIELKDRITLGVVAGVIGNLAKNIATTIMQKIGVTDPSLHFKAAGIFLTRKSANTARGKSLGILVDLCIACKLGIILVYFLSATGRDNYYLKGANVGQSAWVVMYGVLSSLGATKNHPVPPKTSFANFVAHTVFGLVAAKVIVALGDPNLFKPRYNTLGNPSEEK